MPKIAKQIYPYLCPPKRNRMQSLRAEEIKISFDLKKRRKKIVKFKKNPKIQPKNSPHNSKNRECLLWQPSFEAKIKKSEQGFPPLIAQQLYSKIMFIVSPI